VEELRAQLAQQAQQAQQAAQQGSGREAALSSEMEVLRREVEELRAQLLRAQLQLGPGELIAAAKKGRRGTKEVSSLLSRGADVDEVDSVRGTVLGQGMRLLSPEIVWRVGVLVWVWVRMPLVTHVCG
jgi:16S rRNA G1207 methylase RsmC